MGCLGFLENNYTCVMNDNLQLYPTECPGKIVVELAVDSRKLCWSISKSCTRSVPSYMQT